MFIKKRLIFHTPSQNFRCKPRAFDRTSLCLSFIVCTETLNELKEIFFLEGEFASKTTLKLVTSFKYFERAPNTCNKH